MDELKILIHLGHHVNIVNLLGAVTKNIQKGTKSFYLYVFPFYKKFKLKSHVFATNVWFSCRWRRFWSKPPGSMIQCIKSLQKRVSLKKWIELVLKLHASLIMYQLVTIWKWCPRIRQVWGQGLIYGRIFGACPEWYFALRKDKISCTQLSFRNILIELHSFTFMKGAFLACLYPGLYQRLNRALCRCVRWIAEWDFSYRRI